ncbi:MAG: GNAT family N-acetyltransferase [Acidobacteriota bacterium]
MNPQIRDARPEDAEQIETLMPRLGAFESPPWRRPEDLWRGDWQAYRTFFEGKATQCFVRVAVDDNVVLGTTLTTLQPEPLSGEPSAHLQVLVLSEAAQGKGLGRRLLEDAHEQAAARGALSITLHVFEGNERARRLYARNGYEEEMIRCIRPLVPAPKR